MKLNNNSEYTINFTRKALAYISRHADLSKPQEVKMFIALLQNVTDGYKKNLCIAYNKYCKRAKIQWEMPKYAIEARNIALPTREKLQMLIAHAGKLLSMKLQLSIETGLRPVELVRLRVKGLDLDHKTVNPTTAKKGNARTVPLSENLTTKLRDHIIAYQLNPNDQMFKGATPDHYGKQYRKMRNALADKLKDPTIRTIRLYDFRHYFCTKKLYDTNNPYTVMVLMGHKKIETTQKYMHLMNLDEAEWICSGATTAKEATQLIEAGFIYQTTIEGIQLFRKRKQSLFNLLFFLLTNSARRY
jgi:integrase